MIDGRGWLAPIVGATVFLLIFTGTFLIMRGVENREDPSPGVVVGSCVTKDPDGRLTQVNCAGDGARRVTQITEAGQHCDDPADTQHIFTAAGRPTICVRAAG